MSKLIDILRQASQPREETQEEIDLRTFRQAVVIIADTLLYQTNAMSALARKRGVAWVLSQMSDEEAKAIPGLIALTQQLWEAGSSEPFPAFPQDPDPVEAPTE